MVVVVVEVVMVGRGLDGTGGEWFRFGFRLEEFEGKREKKEKVGANGTGCDVSVWAKGERKATRRMGGLEGGKGTDVGTVMKKSGAYCNAMQGKLRLLWSAGILFFFSSGSCKNVCRTMSSCLSKSSKTLSYHGTWTGLQFFFVFFFCFFSTQSSALTNLLPIAHPYFSDCYGRVESYTAKPAELCCLGSPAASNVPFGSLRKPWAVDAPGATQVTLCPRLFMKAVVSLL